MGFVFKGCYYALKKKYGLRRYALSRPNILEESKRVDVDEFYTLIHVFLECDLPTFYIVKSLLTIILFVGSRLLSGFTPHL